MTNKEAIFSKIKTCEAILEKCNDYGTNESPLTMGVFKAIIKEVLNEGTKEFLFAYEKDI